jgi:hypothetical protein
MVTLQKFKGFYIRLDLDSGEFFAWSKFNQQSEKSTTMKAIKAKINKFVKENGQFKPFVVTEMRVDRDSGAVSWIQESYTVIGARANGNFVAVNKEGETKLLTDYDKKSMYLDIPEQARVDFEAVEEKQSEAIAKIRKATDKAKAAIIKEHLQGKELKRLSDQNIHQ